MSRYFKWCSNRSSFDYDELKKGLKLTDEEFKIIKHQERRVDGIFTSLDNDRYCLNSDSFFDLIDYKELQEAKKSAKDANIHALKAQNNAKIAIWISIAAIAIQIFLIIFK